MLGGVGENMQTPAVPVFTPIADPPAFVDAGVVERLSKAMSRAKLSSGYTKAIGEALMIENTATDSGIPVDAKPTGSTTAMMGSIVRIDWTKGKFDSAATKQIGQGSISICVRRLKTRARRSRQANPKNAAIACAIS